MADLTITQIPADPADRDLRPGDDLLANRAGVDIKARVPTYAELTNGKLSPSVIPDNAGALKIRTSYNSADSNTQKTFAVPSGVSLTSITATGIYSIGSNPSTIGAYFQFYYLPNHTDGVVGYASNSAYQERFSFDPWPASVSLTGLSSSFRYAYRQKTFTPTNSNKDDAKIIQVVFNSFYDGWSSGGSAQRLMIDWTFS